MANDTSRDKTSQEMPAMQDNVPQARRQDAVRAVLKEYEIRWRDIPIENYVMATGIIIGFAVLFYLIGTGWTP